MTKQSQKTDHNSNSESQDRSSSSSSSSSNEEAESVDPRAATRERNKQRVLLRRERETSEERQRRREMERIRASERRRNESPTERETRRLKGRCRAMLRRKNETPSERAHRREQNRLRMAERRRAHRLTASGSSAEPRYHHANEGIRMQLARATLHADTRSDDASPMHPAQVVTSNTAIRFASPAYPGLLNPPIPVAPSRSAATTPLPIQPTTAADLALLFHPARLMPPPRLSAGPPPTAASLLALGHMMPTFAHMGPAHANPMTSAFFQMPPDSRVALSIPGPPAKPFQPPRPLSSSTSAAAAAASSLSSSAFSDLAQVARRATPAGQVNIEPQLPLLSAIDLSVLPPRAPSSSNAEAESTPLSTSDAQLSSSAASTNFYYYFPQ
ncbi:hypothetical protein GGI04_000814 [Coemansia thaxteri]|nr:hypothetical protein GGI04_000814 [Coemansia thaxteri]KAJ2485700.1 hypothetical protein EV174_001568 [Coemansia sp. RSA 2320]